MTVLRSRIIRSFDAAAARYDAAASLQARVAKKLVSWAVDEPYAPSSLLDIGSGTGFVAKELYRCWPEAKITALDASPSMLDEAKRKMPQLATIVGDASRVALTQKFDAAFSSMALHWLPHPEESLRLWQSWLNPGGKLFVAIPVEGSFSEWRALCRESGVKDGLWPLPRTYFGEDMASRWQQENVATDYANAEDFLHSIKSVGASAARKNHKPLSVSEMRRVLNASPRPMTATYRLAFLEIPALDP